MHDQLAVGFSGTRKGMTAPQKAQVTKLLHQLSPDEAHHGDCVGSDEEFHQLCRQFASTGKRELVLVGHPPEDPKQRAHCSFDRVLAVKAYLARNRDIVDQTDAMITTPGEDREPLAAPGQGTWSTIRYARRTYSRLYIVWPDGRIT